MLNNRLIPTLVLNNQDLIHRKLFDKNTDRYVGDPINTINVFNEFEVDEISIIDVSATLNNKINFFLLEEIAGEAFFHYHMEEELKKLKTLKKLSNLDSKK